MAVETSLCPGSSNLPDIVFHEIKSAIAELALHLTDDCVKFSESERNIYTKANLNFEVLKDIADHLCFNISFLSKYKRHLNTLVNLRNNIAHGSFPSSMDYDIFNEYAESVIGLVESFENIVICNLDLRSYCSIKSIGKIFKL